MKELILKELQQSRDVLEAFMADENNIIAIQKAAEIMINCIKSGGKIIACGNGGSMSDAMHFASELTGRYRKDRKPLPALAISDPGHLSCVANDFGYPDVFSRFISAHGNYGDVLLALSTSGNSVNINYALVETIDNKNMNVIMITGSGKMATDHNRLSIIRVPHSGTADRTQETTIIILHILVMLIEKGVMDEN